MRRLLASDDKKTYHGLTSLLEDVADKCNAQANVLEGKRLISLYQEFQEDLGQSYKDDYGTDAGEDINSIVEELREISDKLNMIAEDIAETARVGK